MEEVPEINSAHLHASPGQSPQGGLSTGSGGLGSIPAGGAQLDVQRRDAQRFH